ncbi:hypothetical protein B0H34DRAFT_694779 [Crassisporium funariophilum]|nr:hypothetical protein B0H34DRAFT_694779 [Crassisporium funariophilum]
MGRTVQDFETYGIQNLRSFMRGCTLPNLDNCDPRDFTRLLEIDWYNKIYKNRLNVRSEPWRKLENIYKLPAFITGSVIPDWLNGLPSGTLRRVIIDAKERPEARSNLAGILPEFWAHKPCVFNNVIPWMDLALVTATKVLHHSHPSTRDWAFVLCEGDREDLAIFRHFVWCPPIYQQRGFRGTRVGLLVVAIQPHWVLTDKDLEKFVNCKSFPPFSMPGYAFPSVLEGPIRVWAKMWDTCVNAKAQYFVLSTYNQWVFGGFSEGYRTGFVSPIYKNDATSPTIIEYLSFWVATSMKLNNTYGLPKVGDEVPNPYESPSTAYDALLFGSDAVLALCHG